MILSHQDRPSLLCETACQDQANRFAVSGNARREGEACQEMLAKARTDTAAAEATFLNLCRLFISNKTHKGPDRLAAPPVRGEN